MFYFPPLSVSPPLYLAQTAASHGDRAQQPKSALDGQGCLTRRQHQVRVQHHLRQRAWTCIHTIGLFNMRVQHPPLGYRRDRLLRNWSYFTLETVVFMCVVRQQERVVYVYTCETWVWRTRGVCHAALQQVFRIYLFLLGLF